MNSKKEVIVAALFALLLAFGLGIMSFSLFAEVPVPEKPKGTLQIFTERNGLISKIFLPKDNVSVNVRVTCNDEPVAMVQIALEVTTPNGTVFLQQAAQTNSLGIATITFQIPHSNDSIGVWHVKAEGEAYQQLVNGTADFECVLLLNLLDVYTQKSGRGQNMPGGTFVLDENVTLYAEIKDELNETVPDKQIAFEVKGPDRTTILMRVQQTNSSGIATITFRIPLVESFIGTWEVYVRAEYKDAVLLDTLTFRCQPQE